MLLSSHQDFSHGLWAPLLRAVGPIKWLSRPGPSLPRPTGTRLGLPNLFFLLGLSVPPLSMPGPWREKKADSPGPSQGSALLEDCLFETHLSLSLG